MTAAAKSVCYFGFYLYIVGLTLIAVPNLLLKTLQFPETNEVWIRVAGVVVLCIAYYYHRVGAENIHAFFKHTIPTRLFVFASFTAFVLLDYVSPALILLAIPDFAGAVWTWIALKKTTAT